MSTTNPTNITTEWEDQMVKRDIWSKREKEPTNEEIYKETIDNLENIPVDKYLSNNQIDELINKEDDYELELKKIRMERLRKMKENYIKSQKFGQLYHIQKSDFVKDVTDASKDDNIVVCSLYDNSVEESLLVNSLFSEYFSKKYGYIKFVKGVGNEIIDKYPISSIPTIIIYKNGQSIAQITRKKNLVDSKGDISISSIQNLLVKHKVIDISQEKQNFETETKDNFNSDSSDNDDIGNKYYSKNYSSLRLDYIQNRLINS